MNAYRGMKRTISCLALCAALLSAPAAMALETAPLVPGMQQAQQGETRMAAFGRNRGFMGISASDKSLLQARVGGMMLNLRLHTQLGEQITFHEDLGPAAAGEGKIRLSLMATHAMDDIMLQFDQDALNTLQRLNITEIAVAGAGRAMVGVYQVEDLGAVRAALGLKAAEMLCISSEDDPVSVVSEDGVRRFVTH